MARLALADGIGGPTGAGVQGPRPKFIYPQPRRSANWDRVEQKLVSVYLDRLDILEAFVEAYFKSAFALEMTLSIVILRYMSFFHPSPGIIVGQQILGCFIA